MNGMASIQPTQIYTPPLIFRFIFIHCGRASADMLGACKLIGRTHLFTINVYKLIQRLITADENSPTVIEIIRH